MPSRYAAQASPASSRCKTPSGVVLPPLHRASTPLVSPEDLGSGDGLPEPTHSKRLAPLKGKSGKGTKANARSKIDGDERPSRSRGGSRERGKPPGSSRTSSKDRTSKLNPKPKPPTNGSKKTRAHYARSGSEVSTVTKTASKEMATGATEDTMLNDAPDSTALDNEQASSSSSSMVLTIDERLAKFQAAITELRPLLKAKETSLGNEAGQVGDGDNKPDFEKVAQKILQQLQISQENSWWKEVGKSGTSEIVETFASECCAYFMHSTMHTAEGNVVADSTTRTCFESLAILLQPSDAGLSVPLVTLHSAILAVLHRINPEVCSSYLVNTSLLLECDMLLEALLLWNVEKGFLKDTNSQYFIESVTELVSVLERTCNTKLGYMAMIKLQVAQRQVDSKRKAAM